METGQRTVQPRDIRDLAALYHLPSQERDLLADLARGARQKAWYDSYELPPTVAEFYGLESAARRMRWVEPAVVPGVFQTPAYTREVLAVLEVLPERSLLRLEDQVEIRRLRQQRLLSDEVDLEIIVAEAALLHCAGGPRVMVEQIDRLVDASHRPKVDIRVLETANSLAAANAGPFILLSLQSARLGDWLFQEQALGISSDADVVRRFSAFFENLMTNALSPSGSVQRLLEIRRQWLERA